jgi:NAD(P)-dependent dehydrogenase (short-subunit alcohol dehydrogenase family)
MTTRSIHQFAEKVALITDVTDPIGNATALQLALNGSYVIAGVPEASDFDPRPIDDLRSLGTLAMSVQWEQTAMGAEDLIRAVREKFERLDLLVNILKSERQSSFVKQKKPSGARLFERDTIDLVTLSAIELMAARPKPKIVNIVGAVELGQDTSEVTRDQDTSEVTRDITAFARSLRRDLPVHFRSNVIVVNESPVTASGFDPELIRPGAAVPPDDAARVVLFLLSSESVSINGQVIELG